MSGILPLCKFDENPHLCGQKGWWISLISRTTCLIAHHPVTHVLRPLKLRQLNWMLQSATGQVGGIWSQSSAPPKCCCASQEGPQICDRGVVQLLFSYTSGRLHNFQQVYFFVHVKKAEFLAGDLPWGDNKFMWWFRLARLAAFKWFGFSTPENCFLTHGNASLSSVRENWPFCLGSPLCPIRLFSEKRWVWVSLIIILLKVKLVPLTASERSRSFKSEREGVN